MREGAVPPAHRGFRLAVLAVLVCASVLVGRSGPVHRVAHATLRVDKRVTVAIWRPLTHGGGWAAPMFPAPPSPSPSHPAVSHPPSPAAPPPVVPSPTHKPKKKKG